MEQEEESSFVMIIEREIKIIFGSLFCFQTVLYAQVFLLSFYREQSRHARPASPLLETEYGSPPSPPEAEEGEEDEDSDDGSGTAVAATGFVAAFILVLMITVGVALNICR